MPILEVELFTHFMLSLHMTIIPLNVLVRRAQYAAEATLHAH